MIYFNIPTTAGLAELADALGDTEGVPFTHIALGDGNGAPVVPAAGQVALVHEVHRVAISAIKRHDTDPSLVIFEAAVPEDVGGWTVRETGLIGGRVPGMLMAVGSYPAVEKTTMDDGHGRALVIRIVVKYVSAAAVSLTVDSQAYATAQSVLQAIEDHKDEADPHPQYLTKAEADAFYDEIGLAAAAIALDAERLSTHVAHADPHPQYLNAERAAGNWAEQFFYAAGQ